MTEKSVSRRRFLKLAIAGAVVAAAGAGAYLVTRSPAPTPEPTPATPIALRLGIMKFGDPSIRVAEERGYYEQYGVKVEPRMFGMGIMMMEPVVAGQLDGGLATLGTAMIARSSGVPMKLAVPQTEVVEATADWAGMKFFVYEDSSIDRSKPNWGLIGARIPLVTGSINHWLTYLMVQKAGLEWADIQPIEILDFGDIPSIMITRKGVDGSWLTTLQEVQVLDKRKDIRPIIRDWDILGDYTLSGVFLSDKFVKEQPQAAVGFVKATLKGKKFIHKADNFEIVLDYIMKFYKQYEIPMKRDLLYKIYKPGFPDWGNKFMLGDSLKRQYEALLGTGLLKEPLSEPLIDNLFHKALIEIEPPAEQAD